MKLENVKLKRCFLRFEPGINNGTAFIFNKENGNILEGDYYFYIVAKTIQEEGDIDKLIKLISNANEVSEEETEKNICRLYKSYRMKDLLNDERRHFKKSRIWC